MLHDNDEKGKPIKKVMRERINNLCGDIGQLLDNFTNETGLVVESVHVYTGKSFDGAVVYSCEVILS